MELHKAVRNSTPQGNFQREAQQAVVDSVEARWKRENDQKRRAKRLAMVRGFLAMLVLVLIAAGIGWYFFVGQPKNLGDLTTKAQEFAAQVKSEAASVDLSRVKIMPSKKDDAARANEYAKLIAGFKRGELGLWKSASAAISPKTAAEGTVYHALIPRKTGGFDIYEMKKTGKTLVFHLLSPFAAPIEVSNADFQKARSDGRFLILHAEKVYACGKLGLKDAEKLRATLK